MSTLLRGLPEERRAPVERELVPLARAAALGDLAADIAHDVANPLFGVLGLVDLLLDDATPGSEDEERLRLLRQTALEMKRTLSLELEFARSQDDGRATSDLVAATQSALALVRHGVGRSLEVAEEYATEPQLVACPRSELVQAVLHLLQAARASGGPVLVGVADCVLRVGPAAGDSLDLLIAERIAADHGGAVERRDARWALSLPQP